MKISSSDLRTILGKPRRKTPRQPNPLALIEWERQQRAKSGIFLPLRVTNPLNNRRHWRTVWIASKNARMATASACRRSPSVRLPIAVTLTRYGPRSLDEGCGLNASLKPVRDGVADALGIDDADPRIRWVYQQEKSKFYGVRVETEAR